MNIQLNLLPEEQKDYLNRQRIFGIVLQQILYVVVLLILFVAILYSVNIVLGTQMSEQKATLENQQGVQSYQDLTEMQAHFKQTNRKAGDVDRVQKHHFQWALLLSELEGSIVGGVEFESIRTDEAKVTIVGFARSRDVLTKQIEALQGISKEENQCLIDVKAADDDLFKKENFDFTITFMANEQCLKTK